MQIFITPSLSQAEKALTDLAKRKLPRAVLNAVNDVAFDIRVATQQEMKRVFDRPTPFALRMLEVVKATDKAHPEAIVRLDDDRYMDVVFKHLYLGGSREQKRMERRLIASGVMKPGMIAVPGKEASLDRYGNIRGSFITMLLSYFRTLEIGNMSDADRSRRARKGKSKEGFIKIRGIEYFVSFGRGYRGAGNWNTNMQHLAAGIYSRTGTGGSNIKPILMFVRRGQYRRWLNLEQIARDTHGSQYEQRLANRLARAIAGALGDTK